MVESTITQPSAGGADDALPSAKLRRLGPADIALFAELLAGLVRARVPLPAAFKLLARDSESARLRKGFAALELETAAGVPLPEALRKHSDLFPDLFVSLIESGIQSNDLHGALLEIVREFRSQSRFRDALWTQLIGPAATSLAFIVIVTLLIMLNIPSMFKEIFKSLRVELPLMTRTLLFLSDLFQSKFVLGAIASFAAAGVILAFEVWRNPGTRKWIQRQLLSFPYVGSFLTTLLLGRFCRLSSILLKRRIPLDAALKLAAQSTAHLPMRDALLALQRDVEAGRSFSDAVSAQPIFPASFAYLISGSQLHGDLPDTLDRLADLYEGRLNNIGVQLSMAIYVIATLMLALVVAWVVLALFQPIFHIHEALRRK